MLSFVTLPLLNQRQQVRFRTMATAHIAHQGLMIIYLFALVACVFGKDQHQSIPGSHSRPVRLSQENILRSPSERCTSFKYSSDGLFFGCGYSFDVFQLTSIQNLQALLSPYLSPIHLSSLDQQALRSRTYDIRSAANISFAFESGTKNLFTAWGPTLQLRFTHSSANFELFENIHPNRPPYTHECAPFCAVLRNDDAEGRDRDGHIGTGKQFETGIGTHQRFQNDSYLRMLDYSLPFHDSRTPAVRQFDIAGCEDCNFGTFSQSCPDIMRTCLNNEFSCSNVPKPETDQSSIFCMGIHHVFLNPETSFCPLDATRADIYMYGICDCIYYQVKDKIDSGQYHLEVYKWSPDSTIRQLQISERATDSSIRVLLLSRENDHKIIKKAIEQALKNNDIGWKDKQYIHYRKTKNTIRCKQVSYRNYKSSCTVQIIMKRVVS